MNFTPIFSFLESFEPYIKTYLSIWGMVTNYIQNTKIDNLEKELSKIQNILGLKNKILTSDELKIITLFIKKAEEKNSTIKGVSIYYSEFKNLDIDGDIDDVLNTLVAYKFLEVFNFILVSSGEKANYKLSYITYRNSNLIQHIFNDSVTYAKLFKLVVDYIYKNHRNESSILTNILIDKIPLSNDLLNPILDHLSSINVIKLSQITQQDVISSSFILQKDQLYNLYMKLNDN